MPPKRVRISAGFLDPGYVAYRKQAGLTPAEHPGIDINISGTAGDQDLGYPVVSIAEGKVLHVGKHRVWGWIVLVEHPDPPGYPKLWSQYAHLAFVSVEPGQWILPGEAIGSIGKGDPAFPMLAHLHFEIRKKPLPPDFWPGMDRKAILDGYIDPKAYLEQYYDPAWRFRRDEVRLLSDPNRVPGPYLLNLDPERRRIWIRKI